MIVVTGGAGMIGSNIVAALNARGLTDILIVDNLKNGRKMSNLADLNFVDYLDRDDFLAMISGGAALSEVTTIFHQGACSATTEWDGQFMMRNNFEYSKRLLHWAQKQQAQFIYASSASVYGLAKNGFQEDRACELPINMYALSKLQFDQYVRHHQSQLTSQVVGLRYFNVFGPREEHKGGMSSTPFHFNRQIRETGVAKLFAGTDGNADGMQRRDFVSVRDCVAVNLWFMDHEAKSGIFNLGTGIARSFNDVANAVISWHGNGSVEYIPFPEHLKGAYQSFTQADISKLRAVGYDKQFLSLEDGVADYMEWLNGSST